ncbi:MAG: hypothetical protein ABL973_05190 [Micropepsaceae bacterium]
MHLALCFGCSDGRSQAWIGHNLDELIRAWGPPTSQAALSDGSKIVEWSLERTVGGSYRYPDGSGGTWRSSPINQHCWVRMDVRADNIIAAAKVDGNLGGCNTLFRDKPAPGDNG